MGIDIDRCAFVDIHRDTAVTCVRAPDGTGGRRKETRTFGTTTGEIMQLRVWLAVQGVTLVGMESTGIYWKPIYYLLEDDFECWLINAAHMRNVPGKKTDVLDAEWGAELVEHGLVRPSFVPPKPIRELRDLTRYRKTVIEERGRGDPAAAQGFGGCGDQGCVGGVQDPQQVRAGHARRSRGWRARP